MHVVDVQILVHIVTSPTLDVFGIYISGHLLIKWFYWPSKNMLVGNYYAKLLTTVAVEYWTMIKMYYVIWVIPETSANNSVKKNLQKLRITQSLQLLMPRQTSGFVEKSQQLMCLWPMILHLVNVRYSLGKITK